MKGNFFGALFACAALLWLVSPVSGAEMDQPQTFIIAQAASEATASQPTESPAPATEPAPTPAEMAPAPASEQPPAKEAPPAEPMARTGIQIEDAVVCQDVVDRMPIGSGDVFPKETAKVYCYTRVVGMENGGTITHNWYYKGTLKASIKLTVRSSDWRTWSSKNMIPEWSGEWMVEVLSEEGTPLESIVFYMQ